MRTQFLGLVSASIVLALGTLPACGGAAGDGGASAAGGAVSGGAGAASAGAPAAGAPAGGAPGAAGTGQAGAPNSGGAAGSAAGSGGAAGSAAGSGGAAGGTSTGDPNMKVVGYIPNYNGSFSSWAAKVDFTKMTHLNLAFALAGANDNSWSMGASDTEVKALVDKAHAAGVKVLASLGGGGGDQTVIKRYNTPSNIDPLLTNLDAFLKRLNLDGADVDIESAGNLNANFATFSSKLVTMMHAENKLATTAIAQYLIDGANTYSDATMQGWDFINVMIYTNKMSDFTSELKWFTDTKKVPKTKLVVGAGFFGTDSTGKEYAYLDIMKADSMAWSKNQATVSGKTVNYTGIDTMKSLATLSKGYGGIMYWEYTEDVTGEHSLWKAIQDTM